MNDDSALLTVDYSPGELESQDSEPVASLNGALPATIPDYLQDTYWWAYLHPRAVKFWEREWLVNAILWGQMNRLTAEVIKELDLDERSNLLQIACVYGAFSSHLCQHTAASESKLHLVDIAPVQLANARKKLSAYDNVSYHLQDSSELRFPDDSFEQSVLYFLLHEQPEAVRRRTLAEALRVTRPGGKIVIVDYHRPEWWNGLRAVMWPVLRFLEPFALDLWRKPVHSWLPPGGWKATTRLYGGGLYQKTTIRKFQ